jgi:hypothetical protein
VCRAALLETVYEGFIAYCRCGRKKVKSMCLIKYHAMKTYGGVEV